MAWRNDADRFGSVSRAIHWTMAVLILAQVALGLRIADMVPALSTLWLYGLHKTLGLIALALVLARIVWHRISPPPRPLGEPKAWKTIAARAAHAVLYVLMLAIPLSGWIASSATGIDVVIFGSLVLPPIAPVSETWETAGFAVHDVLGKLLMAVVLLHVAGALKRAMAGDGTLGRMLRGVR